MDNQPTFLHLPQTIRNKIYCMSGLVRPCPIDLSNESKRVALMKERKNMEVELWEEPDFDEPRCRYLLPQYSNPVHHKLFGDCLCQPLPTQLLYLSRTLYHETVSVLYGRNRFSVSCRKQVMLDHLNPLETLSLHAWANIQYLHLELTATLSISHGVPKYEVLDWHGSTGNAILTRWTAICAFIAARITPFQLRLSVLCAVEDFKTAIDVTESMSQLPPLNKCSVHFGHHPDSRKLRSLAKASALRLTNRDDKRLGMSESCWKNLPSEVRSQILMETDLVQRKNPKKKYITNNKINIEDGRFVTSSPLCCWQCTEALTTCFCSPYNAAFSDTCVCSPVPTAIFQVSKLFNHEARAVFFSKNVFKFTGSFSATTRFLAGLPDLAIQNMRVIELHLDFERIYFGLSASGRHFTREWYDLIALLRDRLLLSKVWLSVLAIDTQTEDDLVSLNDNGDHDYSWLHTTSFRLLKPLKKLKGLRKFHVSLCWSTEFEAIAEKAVMGPEYDSIAEGKPRYGFCPELKSLLRMPMIETLAKTNR